MLRNLKDLEHYRIHATDGLIGHVADFYVEDDSWVVRYLVVDTGSWLSGRKVLISPVSVGQPDWLERTMPVAISREQVRTSPDIGTDPSVSKQNEEDFMGFYGYSGYWGGDGLWGAGMYPYAMAPGYAGDRLDRVARERELEGYLAAERVRHRHDDRHLQSCNAVVGYHVHATDGDIGHVAGFLVDDETWLIRYLVVDTSNWWLGHKVLVAPSWIDRVKWSDRSVRAGISRESIKGSPPYDKTIDWSREQDLGLYRHHGRSGYGDGSREFAHADR